MSPPCDTETALASLKTSFFQDKQWWETKTSTFNTIADTSKRLAEAADINRLRLSLDPKTARIRLHHVLDIGAGGDSVVGLACGGLHHAG